MLEVIKRKVFSSDAGVLFAILSLAYFKDFFLSCTSYLNLSFDQQIPLTWDFTSLNNILPYKDIYFPYGILFYFKSNAFLQLINFFLPSLLFTSIYLIFKKISGSRLFGFASFICFYLFIHKYTGVENFTRYGIILSLTIVFSYIFYKSRVISVRSAFLFGILIGSAFSLVNDQGIYAFLLFIFFVVMFPLLRKTEKLNYFKFLMSRITVNLFGIIVGFLPFFMFLIANGITHEFFSFMRHLSDFILYAKTPFIPFSTTTDNLFAFGALFIAIVVISYKIFFSKKKFSLISFLEIGLVFILVLLEQKNIIRSIDKQITFVAFFLFLVMFYELIENKIRYFFKIFCYMIISGFVLLGFGLHPFINYNLSFNNDLVHPFFYKNIEVFLSDKSRLCLSYNLTKLVEGKHTKFERIKQLIEKDAGGYTRIFNYLSDPIFYILFNQKPPYYFTIFESTPLYAQEQNIKYIKENSVRYIIYNNDALRVQDGVPDIIRTRLLFKYMLSNFKELGKVENFIIYKRNV